MSALARAASRGLQQLGLGADALLADKLVGYIRLLRQWNRTYNLVSRRSGADILTHHVLDCLVALPHIRGAAVLDVGTGAGLPGLILAMADPDLQLTLVDASAKKTRFCLHAVATLELPNVEVRHARVEQLRVDGVFDTVVTRAFGRSGELPALLELCRPGGRLVALKGPAVREELPALGAWRESARLVPLEVPGLGAERYALVIEKPGASCRMRASTINA